MTKKKQNKFKKSRQQPDNPLNDIIAKTEVNKKPLKTIFVLGNSEITTKENFKLKWINMRTEDKIACLSVSRDALENDIPTEIGSSIYHCCPELSDSASLALDNNTIIDLIEMVANDQENEPDKFSALKSLEDGFKMSQEDQSSHDPYQITEALFKLRSFYLSRFLVHFMMFVVEFANSNIPVESKCAICGLESKSICSRCQSVFYCSKEHQKQDWLEHKKVCISSKQET